MDIKEAKEVICSLLTGAAVGLLFAKLKLPIPAPQNLVGVMGIVGIFLGYVVASKIGWGR
jgi:XapX domain-containing protein